MASLTRYGPVRDVSSLQDEVERMFRSALGERGNATAAGFRRIERHFGRFHRAVRLPDRVDPDGVEATYNDGMLTIRVPKAEESKPRRIAVRAS